MKLKKLIENVECVEVKGSIDIDVEQLTLDSNNVTKGSLYFCLVGNGADGHDYVRQVELYGAVAIVTERCLDYGGTQIIVKDSRKAMSVMACNFYGNVSKKMKLVGVIGTNGKTSTSHLIKWILDGDNKTCGVIGTLGAFYCDRKVEHSLTTPDPIELNKILKDMYDCGVTTVIMEISAHAIHFDKIKGLEFYACVFTNFSQDHLDFFVDMQTYKDAKLKFFNQYKCRYVVTNSDDNVGWEIFNLVKNSITYGIDNPADVFAIEIEQFDSNTCFVINLFDCVYSVKLPLIGTFNVYNALAAASISALLGVKPSKVVERLNSFTCVSGRLEKVYDGEFKVYVDYAHTPDGLQKVLNALRDVCKNHLICVFGCGGNRDKGKREVMGEICALNADYTIITSDNPRFEEPMEIIASIEKGVLKVGKNYVAIEKRQDAINYALSKAKQGDVILVAGKGGENYQEILGIKKPYNDKDIIQKYLRGTKT